MPIHFSLLLMLASGRQGVGGRPTHLRLDNITVSSKQMP